MMVYYSEKEALAVKQIAQRIMEMPGREWNDWSSAEVLNPELKQFIHEDINIDLRSPFRSLGKVKRLNSMDRWYVYQNLLKDFPRFIHMDYQYKPGNKDKIEWVDSMISAAKGHEMSVWIGKAYQNQFSGGVRVARPIKVVKLLDDKSDIYAEVADNKQLGDNGKHKTLKLLYVHNEGKVAPYRTKSFVRRLREALMGQCEYSLVYSHVAECDQPDKRHNAAKDKRFLTHHAWEVTVDGWAHSYVISNLCHYWNLMGFMVTPSPEDSADLAVSFMSDKYKQHLTNLAAGMWAQVFEYNER